MAEGGSDSPGELRAVLEEHGDRPTQRIVTALLTAEGVPKRTIAEALDTSTKTIYNWVDRFEHQPPAVAAFDKPRPGAPSNLDQAQTRQLMRTLEARPSTAGYDAPSWTPALVQDYIGTTFDVEYSRRHVQRLMREAGLTYRRVELPAERPATEGEEATMRWTRSPEGGSRRREHR